MAPLVHKNAAQIPAVIRTALEQAQPQSALLTLAPLS